MTNNAQLDLTMTNNARLDLANDMARIGQI